MTEHTDYGCLEKCYSIWVCRDNVPEDERFSISFIKMSNTRNFGKCNPVEGRAEGIIESGYDFGLSEQDILARLQKKLQITLEQAEGYMKMLGKQPENFL